MRDLPPLPSPRRSLSGAFVAALVLTTAASLAGCGLRVDLPTQQVSAGSPTPAPSSPSATTSATASPATAGATTEATIAAPTSSTTASPAGSSTFDKATFCADLTKAPIKDITGFAVVGIDESKALGELMQRIADTAPPTLRDAAVELNQPVVELVANVQSGEITTVPALQQAITDLGPERLTRWIDAQRTAIAWLDSTC